MADLSKLRSEERAFAELGCAIGSAVRAKGSLGPMARGGSPTGIGEIHKLVVEAVEKLAVAQGKLTYIIQNEVDGMYTGWCGHRQKLGQPLACGCGPAPI